MPVPEYDEDSNQEEFKKVITEFDSKTSSFGVIKEILKGVKIGMDLTKVQAPIFILNPQSVLERMALYCTPNDFFLKCWKSESAETRFMGLVWNVISNWSFPLKKGVSGSKPFNPILGEQFYCTWKHDDGHSTNFWAEQVSHHPPITAYCMENEEIGLKSSGWIRGGASFHVTYLRILFSDSLFRMENTTTGDVYSFSGPDLCIDGILWGSPNVYLFGPVKIDGGRFHATLNFNKNYHMKGEIFDGKEKIHTFEGDMSDKVYLETKGKKVVWFDKKENPQTKIKLGDSRGFHNMHSRKLWRDVTYHMITGNLETAAEEKFLIEEAEREKRRAREKEGIEWIPETFEPHKEYGWILKKREVQTENTK